MNPKILLSSSLADTLSPLSDVQLGRLMRFVFAYSNTSVLPPADTEQSVLVAFNFIREDIDICRERYEARATRARENGRKGGRPRKKKRSTSSPKSSPTSTASKSPLNSESLPQQTSDSRSASAQSESMENPMIPASNDNSSFDPQSIQTYWNSSVQSTPGCKLPSVMHFSNTRRDLVLARLADCDGKPDPLRRAVDMAVRSEYLNHDKLWATFDWVFSAKGFFPTLEGRYLHLDPAKQPKNSHTSQPLSPISQPRPRTADEMEQDTIRKKAERDARTAEMQRANILAAIQAYERNPRSCHARIALNAFADGTLKRLGIVWSPQTQPSKSSNKSSL